MRRAGVVDTFNDLIGFAKVVAAKLGASKSTQLHLQAHEDDASTGEDELWGHAPLLYKPLAGAEAAFITLGDERVAFATKDRRYQISVGDGEVIVRAMGPGQPAYVHLRPDGSCTIHATSIKLGSESASAAVALAPLVEAVFKRIQLAFDAHTHVSAAPGQPTLPPTPVLATTGSVGSSKTRSE